MKKILLLILLLVVLTGCGEMNTQNDDLWGYVHRLVDEEAGVVCYFYTTYGGSGISCLPLEQTRLERK